MPNKFSKRKKTIPSNLEEYYFKDNGNMSNIYFISMNVHKKKSYLNHVKIGVAKDIKQRLAGLQTGSPFILKVWYYFIVDDEKAMSVERDLHNLFRWSRVHGEWFKIHPYIVDFVNAHREMLKSKGLEPKKFILRKKQGGDKFGTMDNADVYCTNCGWYGQTEKLNGIKCPVCYNGKYIEDMSPESYGYDNQVMGDGSFNWNRI